MIPRWMLIIAVALGLIVSAVFWVEFFGQLMPAARDSAFPCLDMTCTTREGRNGTILLVFASILTVATALFITLLAVMSKEGERRSSVR